jgi:hypothetical protein
MEVVLADGTLVRTGMGALTGSPTWQLYRFGFGPAWDQMFVQSNLGIVTKAGLWLMPEPGSLMGMDLEFDRPEDLGPLIDAIAPLRREGVLQQSPTIGNWLRAAAILTTRAEWTDEKGALSDTVIAAIRKKFQMGWWGVSLRLYGRETINREAYAILESEMNKLAAQHEAHELETWRSAGNDRLDRYAAHLPDAERELARWPGRAYRLLAGATAIGHRCDGAIPQDLPALPGIRHGLSGKLCVRRTPPDQRQRHPAGQGRSGHDAPRRSFHPHAGGGCEGAWLRGIPHAP